jgi:hypothetical protein
MHISFTRVAAAVSTPITVHGNARKNTGRTGTTHVVISDTRPIYIRASVTVTLLSHEHRAYSWRENRSRPFAIKETYIKCNYAMGEMRTAFVQ